MSCNSSSYDDGLHYCVQCGNTVDDGQESREVSIVSTDDRDAIYVNGVLVVERSILSVVDLAGALGINLNLINASTRAREKLCNGGSFPKLLADLEKDP